MEGECIYKIILVGDTNVGKTTFFKHIQCKYNDNNNFQSTVGIDFSVFHKINNDTHIKINLWDTAGQEKYKSLIKTYFRDACGYILMFDLNNMSSFESVKGWLNDIEHTNTCNHSHPILLIGNKKDLEIKVDATYIEHLVEYKNIIYTEVSLKEQENVDVIFKLLLDEIYHTLYNQSIKCNGLKRRDTYTHNSITLKTQNEDRKKCCK